MGPGIVVSAVSGPRSFEYTKGMTTKELRAAFRNLHGLREYARATGSFTIDGPDGEVISLVDMEKIIDPAGPLPARTRQAFILSVVEDMPPEAVASDMGISVSTVTGLVHMALKTIGKEWR